MSDLSGAQAAIERSVPPWALQLLPETGRQTLAKLVLGRAIADGEDLDAAVRAVLAQLSAGAEVGLPGTQGRIL